ncbi:MAG: nitronate monooxygenase [Mariprofundaceae bacterium]
MSINLKSIMISGKEALPLIEGGKGVAVSTGASTGAWAAAGGVGTFSAVNADRHDANGDVIPLVYEGKSRVERHVEMVKYAIEGGITQAKIAHETAGGEGRIHMNGLWEMGSAEKVMTGILEETKGLIHGITCGAGMPFRLAPLAASFQVHYYPIISSARAFRALWLRSYRKVPEWLGGVVYEDPWLAGGHNGLSNTENPLQPESPFPRVAQLRKTMNEFGLSEVPIIMAGGVWYLRDWADWLDNPEIGPIAFQLGTRPLLTQESPVANLWKAKLLHLEEGDVALNRFSPTGFYSSAVNNSFMKELYERSQREIAFVEHATGDHTAAFVFGVRNREVFVTPHDKERAESWIERGFIKALITPESTLIFVAPEKAQEIRKDQMDCVGCLSMCKFSNWACNDVGSTGKRADPRSYCIQKTLQDIAHGDEPDRNLMFSGHTASNFASDPFYQNGFIPTVRQLVERICTGD